MSDDKKPLYASIIELMHQKAESTLVSSQAEKELRELGDTLIQSQWCSTDRAGAIMLLRQIAGQLSKCGCYRHVVVYLHSIAHTLGAEPIPQEGTHFLSRKPSLRESIVD